MTQIVCRMVSVYAFRLLRGRAEALVMRRAVGELCGTWQGVHGGIEPGETAWQAALRELREEAGVVPVRFYQLDSLDTFYDALTDTIHHCPCFAAELPIDLEVRLNPEHDAYEWLAPEAAVARLPWPGQRKVLREILAEIVTPGSCTPFLEIPLPGGPVGAAPANPNPERTCPP